MSTASVDRTTANIFCRAPGTAARGWQSRSSCTKTLMTAPGSGFRCGSSSTPTRGGPKQISTRSWRQRSSHPGTPSARRHTLVRLYAPLLTTTRCGFADCGRSFEGATHWTRFEPLSVSRLIRPVTRNDVPKTSNGSISSQAAHRRDVPHCHANAEALTSAAPDVRDASIINSCVG